jgi:hypothetical protein
MMGVIGLRIPDRINEWWNMVPESLGESVCSSGNSSPVLSATAVLRGLRGGAKSVVVRASDGDMYVVKMMGNPQGPNVLANEALGTELARYLGLSVPAWRPIEISDEFLDQNKPCWFETASGLVRPNAGLHFASRVIGQDTSAPVYEVLPGGWISRIENRDDFVGMLLLDVWANHTDHRQSVFVRNPITNQLTAVFIDNGHLFGGPAGRDAYRRGAAMYLDKRVYEGMDLKGAIDRWLQRADSIDVGVLLRLAKSVPSAWMCGRTMEEFVSQLQVRKAVLEQLLHQEASQVKGVRNGRSLKVEARNEFNGRSTKQVLSVQRPTTQLRANRTGTTRRRSAEC